GVRKFDWYHFPLVLVTGAGVEASNRIGIILVVGMLIVTFLRCLCCPVCISGLGVKRVFPEREASPERT
ncbi:MAG: hypothetical protein ACPG5T_07070, partial [Endozoicomonas sp.]